MADDDDGAGAAAAAEEEQEEEETKTKTKKRSGGGGGFVFRLWKGIFGGGGDDFEKKLENLSKEEASVHKRLKKRAHSSRRMARNVIALSVGLEGVAVMYAIMTTRSGDLNWQMRAIRVLPMFVVPALATIVYSALVRLTRMLDLKDQKTLERLRAERKAKIDELKERTNYYTTQQLIQRYDLDPAAKAAAASVLPSKLGSDSGLKVYVGDESNIDSSTGKSNDFELAEASGLRYRKAVAHMKAGSTGSSPTYQLIDGSMNDDLTVAEESTVSNRNIVENYKGSGVNSGGWFARIAALLVGEDPTQCYALICGNCRMHNGLARKEDFLYITYYCPHCHALNGSRQLGEHEMVSASDNGTPTSPDSVSMQDNSSSMSSMSSTPVANSSKTAPQVPVESEQNGQNNSRNASSVSSASVENTLATVEEMPRGDEEK
ncbi:uncharacterized protein At2g24330-like [Ananas comosus]|uniref:Uncharacterized protein At2g24330-like n=1 Tax=Ananas comosus TaxID=4615 RepID=A0A6P5GYL2_ANACO|nr:uncharacterized protein At2g24330-like [Ananas comosus]